MMRHSPTHTHTHYAKETTREIEKRAQERDKRARAGKRGWMRTVSPGVLRFVYTPIWVIQLSGTTDVESMPSRWSRLTLPTVWVVQRFLLYVFPVCLCVVYACLCVCVCILCVYCLWVPFSVSVFYFYFNGGTNAFTYFQIGHKCVCVSVCVCLSAFYSVNWLSGCWNRKQFQLQPVVVWHLSPLPAVADVFVLFVITVLECPDIM